MRIISHNVAVHPFYAAERSDSICPFDELFLRVYVAAIEKPNCPIPLFQKLFTRNGGIRSTAYMEDQFLVFIHPAGQNAVYF